MIYVLTDFNKGLKELTDEQRRVLMYWFLNCEDMQQPNGGCKNCIAKETCDSLRQLFKLEDFDNKVNVIKPECDSTR